MNPSEMTTLTNTLEVFDTYKHRDDKDSDEESFHLPLDDDESDQKIQDAVRNSCKETEEDILNKFETTTNTSECVDPNVEDRLLNEEDEEEKKIDEDAVTEKETNTTELVNNANHSKKEKESITHAQCEEDSPTQESILNGDVEKEEDTKKTEEIEEVQNKADNDSEKDSCAILRNSSNDKDNEETTSDNSEVKSITEQETSEAQIISETTTVETHTNIENNIENDQNDDITEASNEINKQSEDSEDLFDISIIRDAEEDNAENVLNEANLEENQTEENDDFVEDEKAEDEVSNEKARSEEEEEEDVDIEHETMEVDKNEENFKNDDVDIEETNLNVDVEVTKDGVVSDGETENCQKTDLNEKQVDVKCEEKIDECLNCDNVVGTKCLLNEVTGQLEKVKDEIKTEEKTICEDNSNEGLCRVFLKRSLSDGEDDVVTKKTKTDQPETALVGETKEDKPKEKLPLNTLSSFAEFMKNKKSRRLTLHDIEEFCVQKICEVIVHKSDLGDVHHQLKLQEQLIETMRKEIQQLTKQARDLEIVNKKLLNDLKQQTSTQKPLNPLKITRSVGLQVKFTPAFEANAKRRPAPVTALVTTKPSAQPITPNRTGPRVVPNTVSTTVVNRQVSSPQKQQVMSKPQNPLLSQALQNRRVTNGEVTKTISTQARPKAPEPKNGVAASVIDLTDEDDKRDKNINGPTKISSPKSITVPLRTTPLRVSSTTPGIRLTTTQGKVSPITSVVTSSTPQVMYVVQSSPQNVLASTLGPKAVVVNFQPTNGVLTSTLNGSAVSVIPNKQSNTIQLKQVPPSKPMLNSKLVKIKHPAPLPSPPVVRVSSEKPLKPIPPKPHLTIRKTDTGIILQWKMPYELDMYEVIASYQLYAYQETSALPSTEMWRKVGDVKALALPMACTLTQFADKNKYYFAVRPVDIHKRIGMFSEPEEISL